MYTVTQWLTDWLTLRALDVRPRTLECYQDLATRYVIPALGDYDVAELPPLAINALLARTVAEGHGRTAEMVYVLLRSSLADVEPVSPMRRIKRPRHVQHTPEAWSDEHIHAYLAALEGHPHRVALSLAISLGLRRGEVCGLRWRDIDLAEGVLHVCNQRQRMADGSIVDCPPKSASSDRLLPVPAELLGLLREQARPCGYVCSLTPSGLDAAHRRLVRSLGLPYIPLHGLRHSFATCVVRHGGDMRCLQSILGHASYATTADRYTHPDILMLGVALEGMSASVIHLFAAKSP